MSISILIECNLPFDFKKLSFMHYFKLQKLEFKQLIDDITIDL